MLKKLIFVLSLWFLCDWAYTEKIKPFVASEWPQLGGKASVKPKATNPQAKDTATVSVPEISKDSLVLGLDVSHYQGNLLVAMEKSKDSLHFVICKATEGMHIIDSRFKSNARLLQTKKVLHGAYHFYHFNRNPVKQARHFCKVITESQFLDDTQLPPVLDIEKSDISALQQSSLSQIQQNVLLFLNEVEKLTGRIPIIYTDRITGNCFLKNKAFAKYPLWIAAYTNKLTPQHIPKTWGAKWAIWQRSESYSFHDKKFDYDIFNGSHATLKRFIKNSIVADTTAAN